MYNKSRKTKRAELWKLLSADPDMSIEEATTLVGVSRATVYRVRREVLSDAKRNAHAMAKRFAYLERKQLVQPFVQTELPFSASDELELPREKAAETPAPVAVDAVLDARAGTYGRFVDVAETTQTLMGAIATRLAERGTIVQHDQALALQMIVQKLARIANGDPDHLDSWLDIAGYATLVAERLSGKAPR